MPIDPERATVALADTKWFGHHPTYFREFVASLRRLGAFVIALCPQPAELEPREGVWPGKLTSPNHSLILSSRDNDPASTFTRWWRVRQALDAAEDRCGRRADLVFFPYLDNFLRLLPAPIVPDLVLGRPWSGLYFRNQHLGQPLNGAASRLRALAKGDVLLRGKCALPLLGVLDERFNGVLLERSGREAIQFPDITDETAPSSPSPLAITLLERAAGRPIIGLAGSLEKRKGLLTLLRAAEASARAGDALFYAAAGPFAAETFTAEEMAFIEETRERLAASLYLDIPGARIPDGAPYNSIFQAFSIAWAAYENFQGSSNTLTKAALFAKPVLASEGECIGQRVREYRLGAAFPESDAAAARAAIHQVLREEAAGNAARRYEDYRHFHSRPQLDAVFRRLLESLPSRPA